LASLVSVCLRIIAGVISKLLPGWTRGHVRVAKKSRLFLRFLCWTGPAVSRIFRPNSGYMEFLAIIAYITTSHRTSRKGARSTRCRHRVYTSANFGREWWE
jgi:hypothetical protein